MNLEREMSIHTNASVPQLRPSKKARKLQLWTDQSKIKYALRFENELPFLTRTHPEVQQYTTLIAESDTLFKGYEYDWKFMLNRWIESHKAATGFKTRSGIPFVRLESIPKNRKTSFAKKESKSYFYVTTLDGKKYYVKSKSYIECHFCKLLFDTNNKRNEHERAWHSKK
jgi:hypothetical protein